MNEYNYLNISMNDARLVAENQSLNDLTEETPSHLLL